MTTGGRGGAQRIPRPPSFSEGGPAPWADLPAALRRLSLADVRAACATLPAPSRGSGASPETRPAAVLVALFEEDGEARVILTKRPETMPSHQGEIAFPGGKHEPGLDPDLRATALREAHEEIGVDRAEVRVLGRLSPLDIPVSGFTLYPVIAVADGRPALRAADGEVERILEVPLREMLDPARLRRRRAMRDGIEIDVPYFDLGPDELWGATAMVLSEFLWLLGWRPPAPADDEG